MNFGFSYVGLIYLLMLFIPNIIWAKNLPVDYEKYSKNENKILGIFERCGEALTSTCVLIFTDFNLHEWNLWCLWLCVSFFLMVLYEIFWVRYFRSPRTMKDFYGPLLGIPVPGALLPVVAFLLLGVYGKNIFLMIAAVILGIGHIGIHLMHERSIS